MNTIAIVLLFAAILAVGLLFIRGLARNRGLIASNESWPFPGRFVDGKIWRTPDATITSRYLLAKSGTTPGVTAALCGASDEPLGVWTDQPTNVGEAYAIDLLGVVKDTLLMVAAAAITADTDVYTAANGQVSILSDTTGTYYHVGRALTAAANAGDLIAVQHKFPTAVVVS